jgi:SET domain-containing protein
MKSKLFQNKIIVRKSSIHGYGVFAEKSVKKGEIVEECYALLTRVEDDILGDYYFYIRGKNGLLLGYGSIYNHSEDPNVEYNYIPKHQIMVFKANRPIKKGEELFVSYGDAWFKSRDSVAKPPKSKKKYAHKELYGSFKQRCEKLYKRFALAQARKK